MVLQFLSEAVTLTGAGGLIGIVFSLLVALLLSRLFPSLRSQVPAWAVLTALQRFGCGGGLFGVWPAVKASSSIRLTPLSN
jgi:ABC-type antimicrobial peptide transport system permease subunit